MRTIFQSLLAFCFAGFSIVTFAGGPAPVPAVPLQPASIPAEYAGVYVDLSVGYAFANWLEFGQGSFDGYSPLLATAAPVGMVNSNGRGGFTYGFDIGYRINKYLGMEVGWYSLPKVKGNSNVFVSLPDLNVSSWFGYLALKIIAPLSKQFELFFKTGAGYRRLNYDGNAPGIMGFGDSSTNYISAVLGVGFQYWVDENWSLSLQDLVMLKNSGGATVPNQAPTANLVLGSVGYIFGIM